MKKYLYTFLTILLFMLSNTTVYAADEVEDWFLNSNFTGNNIYQGNNIPREFIGKNCLKNSSPSPSGVCTGYEIEECAVFKSVDDSNDSEHNNWINRHFQGTLNNYKYEIKMASHQYCLSTGEFSTAGCNDTDLVKIIDVYKCPDENLTYSGRADTSDTPQTDVANNCKNELNQQNINLSDYEFAGAQINLSTDQASGIKCAINKCDSITSCKFNSNGQWDCDLYKYKGNRQDCLDADSDDDDDTEELTGISACKVIGQGTKLGKIIKRGIRMIRLLIPLLLIALTLVDFFKNLVVDDEKGYKNLWPKFFKRCIFAILILVLPLLLKVLFTIAGVFGIYQINADSIFCYLLD